MRGFLGVLWRILAFGLAVAAALVLGERYLGWPGSVRMFGGGALVVIGSFLSGGGSGRNLYHKAAVRAVDERDIEEYKATRDANLSMGLRLLIVGAVIVASLFVV